MEFLGEGSGFRFFRLPPRKQREAMVVGLMNVERYAYAARFPTLDISVIDDNYKTDPRSTEHKRTTDTHLKNPAWFWVVALRNGQPVGFGIFKPLGTIIHVVELHVHGGTPPHRTDSMWGKRLATTIFYLGLGEVRRAFPEIDKTQLAVDRQPGETHPWQWYSALGFRETTSIYEKWRLGPIPLQKIEMMAPIATVLRRLGPNPLVP